MHQLVVTCHFVVTKCSVTVISEEWSRALQGEPLACACEGYLRVSIFYKLKRSFFCIIWSFTGHGVMDHCPLITLIWHLFCHHRGEIVFGTTFRTRKARQSFLGRVFPWRWGLPRTRLVSSLFCVVELHRYDSLKCIKCFFRFACQPAKLTTGPVMSVWFSSSYLRKECFVKIGNLHHHKFSFLARVHVFMRGIFPKQAL